MPMEGEEQKKSGCGYGCLVGIAVLLGINIFLVVAFMITSFIMGGLMDDVTSKSETGKYGEDEMPDLVETWSSGTGTVKVVTIPIKGVIMMDSKSVFGSGNALAAYRAIQRATLDPKVKGILLQVDSPGGGVTASDLIYQSLQNFKSLDPERKVVTLMGDLAASGGYYVSLASDRIIAQPTTTMGSIGVIIQSMNFKNLAEKIGVHDVTIKSGANKDFLNPFRDESPEQRKILQVIVDDMYDRFITLVANNRKLDKEEVRPLADGRIFTAVQAKKAHLVDSIGYFSDARKELANLLKVEDVKIYKYEEEMSLKDLFKHSAVGARSELQQLLQTQETRLMYQMP